MDNTYRLINKALDSVLLEPGDLPACITAVKKLVSMLKRCNDPKMYDRLKSMLDIAIDCLDPDSFTEVDEETNEPQYLGVKALMTIADTLDYAEKELLKVKRPEELKSESVLTPEQIANLNNLLKK